MKNSVLFVLSLMVVMFSNSAVAQTVVTHMDARDALGRADLAAEGAIAAFDQFFAQKLELEAKVLSAEKIALAAAARGDARLEKKMNGKLDGFKAELAKLDGRLKKLEEEMTAGCRGYADSAAQTACLKTLEAITAGGEKLALEAFMKVGIPVRKVTQEVDGKQTTTEEPAPGAQVPYKKMFRFTGGDTPVYTEITVGERQPIPPIRFQEEGDGGTHPVIKWLVPVAAGALAGGAIAGMADPDGPDGDKYSFGSAGKGAMLGAATGLVVSLIWEIAD